MLRYLVTSRTRRRLLSLLWAEDARGSTAELAELAGAAFAGVHAELKAMQRAQLVEHDPGGGRAQRRRVRALPLGQQARPRSLRLASLRLAGAAPTRRTS